VVTEVDSITGEAKVEGGKIQKAINKGYERARRVGELEIEVNASNLREMIGLLNTKGGGYNSKTNKRRSKTSNVKRRDSKAYREGVKRSRRRRSRNRRSVRGIGICKRISRSVACKYVYESV
jgi:hypothetical protein